jgi:1-acyl-sn-glycerol-3-phosphate acyltransferase
MKGTIPRTLVGVLASLLLGLNIVFWCTFLFFFALLKLALPCKSVRTFLDRILNAIAENWISGNSAWMRLTQWTRWDVAGLEDLSRGGWYLVSSNHQSWADIFVLQHLLNRKIPFLKFYIKKQLLYVPIMGLAWWALDYPFMQRYSREYLEKHPEQRGRDLETTRQACRKFSLIPTSVMNFLEGTRFTPAKRERQGSPYRYLLKPKAGGFGLALSTMGEKFTSLLDVTIVYPDGIPTFWEFLCGAVPRIIVRAQQQPIPAAFIGGDYECDDRFRASLQQWIHERWQAKDSLIGQLRSEADRPPPGGRPGTGALERDASL